MTLLRKRLFEWRANLSLRLTPFRVSLLLTKIFMHDTKYSVFSICFFHDAGQCVWQKTTLNIAFLRCVLNTFVIY